MDKELYFRIKGKRDQFLVNEVDVLLDEEIADMVDKVEKGIANKTVDTTNRDLLEDSIKELIKPYGAKYKRDQKELWKNYSATIVEEITEYYRDSFQK